MAINTAGDGLAIVSGGLVNDVTSGVSLAAPTAPVLTATAVSDTVVSLIWTFGVLAEYYYIWRKLVGGSYARVPDASTTFTTYTYQNTGLTASTSYVYKVTAYNVTSTTDSNEVTVTTSAATTETMTALAQNEFITWQLSSEYPFRKSIVYTPNGGTAKAIYAIVGDKGSKKIAGRGNLGAMYDVEIVISNNATNGIAAVTPNKDTVTFTAPEYGNASNTFMVAGIIGYTPMSWHLGLRP